MSPYRVIVTKESPCPGIIQTTYSSYSLSVFLPMLIPRLCRIVSNIDREIGSTKSALFSQSRNKGTWGFSRTSTRLL